MCVIAVSRAGVPQPSEKTLRTMFANNRDGAGYMVARKGRVEIHKGFMTCDEFIKAVKAENFGPDDPVVYHCRITTQAGVTPYMTHPFPLSSNLYNMRSLDCECSCGVAHNGIIHMTSDPRDKTYSDTAHFVAEYMVKIVKNLKDLKDPAVIRILEELTKSRLAILDGKSGYIATCGNWVKGPDGVEYSNTSYRPYEPPKYGAYDWKTGFSYQKSALYGRPYSTWSDDDMEYDSDTDTWVPARRGKPFIPAKAKKTN